MKKNDPHRYFVQCGTQYRDKKGRLRVCTKKYSHWFGGCKG